jgi:protein-tyrosine phosphatase
MALLRTSHSDPIRVDFVKSEKLLLPGRIGLTFAPGKKHGDWDRDLDADLARLRTEYKTDLLVSLIEEHEFAFLRIPDLRERVSKHGIKTLWYPIRDVSIPTSIETFADAVNQIVNSLSEGRTVVIHCLGGLGRTGLVAAACLMATTDLTPREAIEIVRHARAGTIQTGEQERYIELYRRFLDDQRLSQTAATTSDSSTKPPNL